MWLERLMGFKHFNHTCFFPTVVTHVFNLSNFKKLKIILFIVGSHISDTEIMLIFKAIDHPSIFV